MNSKESSLTSAISAKGVLSYHIVNVENPIVNVLKMKMQNMGHTSSEHGKKREKLSQNLYQKKQIKRCKEFIQNSKRSEKIIKKMRKISIKALNNDKKQ